jgi:two-component system sensor histidine kinase MprB
MAAVAGVAVAVTVLLAAGIVYFAVRANLRGEVERDLERRAVAISEGRDPGGRGGPGRHGGPGHGGPGDPGHFRPPPDRFGGAEGLVQRLDADGRPRPAVIPVSDEAARFVRAAAGGRMTEDAEVQGVHVMVVTVAPSSSGTGVQVARPLTEVDSVLGNVLAVLIVVGVGGIGVAVVLGLGVAQTALAPIAGFTRRTEEIAGRPEALSERIDVVGRDELARLAASFNRALDALERSVQTQRQLVADAGHELRTPIASLRANVQTLEEADRLPPAELAALRADIVSELDELTALVGDVVELARGERPDEALDDVRLDEVVRSLVQRAERRGDKHVRYAVHAEPTLVRGDGERIGRAISNVLDNARKWSPEGGEIEVSLRDGVLLVRDHGPGFAEEDLPRVFERFYRSAAARSMPGSGLGLSIVRQAAEAHGGFAEASNAAGGGAILRVCFGAAVR